MTERLKYLVEILSAQDNKDNTKNIEHLTSLTNSLFLLTQSLFDRKIKVKYYQREIEGKFFRFGLANHSLINLAKGNSFTLINLKVVIGDMFSIKSIARMQIESFIIMFYLFFDNLTQEEKNFKYDIYKIHGLEKQLNFKVRNMTAENIENKKKIETELEESIKNLKSSSIFINATFKEKKKYLNPQYAKIEKSEILFEKSGLNKTRIGNIWQIYSNYAHAEHISDRQYNSAYVNKKSIDEDINVTINTISILTAKLIVFLTRTISEIDQDYKNLNLKNRVLIETWNSM